MPCSKGVINKTCPSRDSTRIAKHTFDAAKIGIISESCKYFAFYFHFLPPRTFNPRDSCYGSETIVIGVQQYTRPNGKGRAEVFSNAIKHDFKSKNPTTRWSDIIRLK